MRGHECNKSTGSLTPFIVQLLHNLANDLADRLYGFDVIFGLVKSLLKVLEREAN